MKCQTVELPPNKDGKRSFAIVCGGRGSSRPVTPPCQFCLHAPGVRQCDHYTGGTNPDGTKTTCDAYLCLRCTVRRGDFDYCPNHREANGFPKPPLNDSGFNLESCRWITARYVSLCVAKLDDRCARSMGKGKRVLYLPKERLVICESCGLQLTGRPEAQASLL